MLKTAKKAKAGQTDRPTDRPTDEVTYRVAFHATKNISKSPLTELPMSKVFVHLLTSIEVFCETITNIFMRYSETTLKNLLFATNLIFLASAV